MEVQKVLHMNPGEDDSSYAKNSYFQRIAFLKVKHVLKQSIHGFCGSAAAADKCIKVADLGCASGPNTLLAIQDIIECLDEEYYINGLNSNNIEQLPSIQIFLNDLDSNDFNAVFKSLTGFHEQVEQQGRRRPSGSLFVAATPGSFYGRLFPENFIHFVYSSNSLHWLSQAPKGLVAETGLPLNKGGTYISRTSPPMVKEAYLDQFSQDFTNFLRMRAIEMVSHGQLFLALQSKSDENEGYTFQELLGMALNDMVAEGIIEETSLDNFILPMYEPSMEEARNIIENEGSFLIKHLETIDLRRNDGEAMKTMSTSAFSPNFAERYARMMRSVFENLLASHFGGGVMDDLFSRFQRKALENFGKVHRPKYFLAISLAKK